jgi:hypothetical protein
MQTITISILLLIFQMSFLYAVENSRSRLLLCPLPQEDYLNHYLFQNSIVSSIESSRLDTTLLSGRPGVSERAVVNRAVGN